MSNKKTRTEFLRQMQELYISSLSHEEQLEIRVNQLKEKASQIVSSEPTGITKWLRKHLN